MVDKSDKEKIGNPSDSHLVKKIKEQAKKIEKLEKELKNLSRSMRLLEIEMMELKRQKYKKNPNFPKNYPIVTWEDDPNKRRPSTWLSKAHEKVKTMSK